MRRLQQTFFAVALALFLGLRAALAAAQPPAPSVKLDIAAQSIGDALNEFARQTGLQIYMDASEGQGVKVGRLVGTFTPEAALNKLLANTGLSFSYVDATTVAISSSKGAEGNKSSAEVSQPGVVRLAQVDPAQTDMQQVKSDPQPSAPEDSASKDKIQEIIVTAQKRQESLVKVPISITVLSGAALDKDRSTGLLELLSSVPGVTTRETFQAGMTSLSVRGVNAPSPFLSASSPIGFYLDSLSFGFVNSAFVPDLSPYDLERVEILRGPQGTLYGASSLNGVVRVLTKEPDLDAFDFKGRASTSSTKRGGASYRGDVAANLPLIEGKLAARAVVGYEDRSGWVDSPTRTDVNDNEIRNVRLKLKAQPTDALTLVASMWQTHSDAGAGNIANPVTNGRTSDDREFTIVEFETYGLRAEYNFPSMSLSSSTHYLEFTNESLLSLDLISPALAGFDTNLYAENFSQEFLLSSNSPGDWRWSAGVFYRDAKDRLFQQLLSRTDQQYRSRSIAVFGQVSRMFMDDRFEISGGLRYFEDDVVARALPGIINTAPPYYRAEAKFDKVSPKATLTWFPNSTTTVYASYGEGFRSGQPIGPAVLVAAPQFPPLGPDKLTNYELGTKSRLLNDRISIDAAVYFIDWRNTQQFVIVTAATGAMFQAGVNSGEISGVGADLSLMVYPAAGLEIGVNAAWNDLEFDQPVLSNNQVLFAQGFRPPYSPEYTLGGAVAYGFDVAGDWHARLETSANLVSRQTQVSLTNGVPATLTGDELFQMRAAASLETPRHWTVTAYVENLTDNRPVIARAAANRAEWNLSFRPRTIGVQLEYDFGR